MAAAKTTTETTTIPNLVMVLMVFMVLKKIKTIETFETFKTIKMVADNAVMPDLAMVLKKSHNQICCQKGAECYTRQKCHRWVVLSVRPIGGIFC